MKFRVNDEAVIVGCAAPYEGAACTVLELPKLRMTSSGAERIWGYLIRVHGMSSVIIAKPEQLAHPDEASDSTDLGSWEAMRAAYGWGPERRVSGDLYAKSCKKGAQKWKQS